jgi:hypothetical protein
LLFWSKCESCGEMMVWENMVLEMDKLELVLTSRLIIKEGK